MKITKPQHNAIPSYAQKYIDQVETDDLIEALIQNHVDLKSVVASMSEERGAFQYAPGKWTVKQLIQHLIDTERILSYRALRFARLDFTELHGFDEDAYATNDGTALRPLQAIMDEKEAVHHATLALFRNIDAEHMDQIGRANNNPFSPRGLGWMIAGHNVHHTKILKERYL